jgi:hypothetical protein
MTDTMIIEAAACMWEQALNLVGTDPAWVDFRENWGTSCVRMEVIQHAAELERDYQTVSEGYPLCFDWDFVPEWMKLNLVLSPGDGSIKLSEARHIPNA